ncbi:MAG: helix-turn-helix domain-containing protein [Pseudomonadota bacterium]
MFRQILTLRTEVEQAVLGLGKRAHIARLALNLFYRKPIVNAGDVEKALEITTPTDNALIKALVELGILVEITGQQRWRSYAFERYLSLFIS